MALFKALFSGSAEQLFRRTKSTRPNGIFLQLRNHDNLDDLDLDELDDILWEYAKDTPTSFLVHHRNFTRMYECLQNPLPKRPLRIVAVFPDPIIPPSDASQIYI